MQLRTVSFSNSNLSLSSVCLGTGAFGTGHSRETIDRIYETFRAAGGDCIDTAHCYCFWLPTGAGASEREFADCIRRHGDGGNVRIITKGGHPSVDPGYVRAEGYLSPEVLSADIEQS